MAGSRKPGGGLSGAAGFSGAARVDKGVPKGTDVVLHRSEPPLQVEDLWPPLFSASEVCMPRPGVRVPKPPALCSKASAAGVGELH